VWREASVTAEVSVGRLLARYRAAAENTSRQDAPDYYANAYEVHSLFKMLRESREGREGLSALMEDADPHVRRWAAAHSMTWDRETARIVLSTLDDQADAQP
jgi:hypothetical protein